MELREAALGTLLGATQNILVQADDRTDQATICNRLIDGRDPPRAVVVSYEQSVEDWLADTQHSALDSVAFVSVGEAVRSTAAATPPDTMDSVGIDERVRIDGVGDPTDLTALGLTIQSHLNAFQEEGSDEVVVCFDSLSALVETVSLRQAFRFLHILMTLISAYDATAHYHYDGSLTTRELATLRPLFDAELASQHSDVPRVWALESIPCPGADE